MERLAHTSNSEEQLSQVVDRFLKQKAPTWRRIVQALQSPDVNCKDLANRLEGKYCSDPPKGPHEGMHHTLLHI